MQVESAKLRIESLGQISVRSAEQIYADVFSRLRPSTPLPTIQVLFRRYANANAQIRFESGLLSVKIADTLAAAPDPVQEALAEILLSKLFRRPVPRQCQREYRRYLSRPDVRRQLEAIRSVRGRKQVSHPGGEHFDLEQMFDEINFRYFFGLMAKPTLGWSKRRSKTLLGHYDPSHNTIVISRSLDRPDVPQLAVEFVLYHEMLHMRHPVEQREIRRCVHTRAFKEEEKRFEGYAEAKKLLLKAVSL